MVVNGIVFPAADGIAGFVNWLVSSIMGWGWVSYGFAIFFFTLFIKLMLSPLDFLNKYFSRRNQVKQQALADEVADLEATYANDPMAFARARQALFQKNGVGGLGSALVALASLIVTMVVFFNVLGALNNISASNINHECEALQAVYQKYAVDDQVADVDAFKTELNEVYAANRTSFFWIKNIWQADTPWTSTMLSFNDFNNHLPEDQKLSEAGYQTIVDNLAGEYQGGNGWLLLVLLAGATSFLSAKLATIMNKRNAPAPKAAKKPEEIITYSMRDAKRQNQTAQPTMDPAQMNGMMQWMMPIIMMIFAITQTSAFAIYMISSSLVSTVLTTLFGFLVEMIIKKQKPKLVPDKDFDPTVINPHAKYFKGGKK